MAFNIGTAIKHLGRHGLKEGNPAVQDLMKAKWYIDREIERLGKCKFELELEAEDVQSAMSEPPAWA